MKNKRRRMGVVGQVEVGRWAGQTSGGVWVGEVGESEHSQDGNKSGSGINDESTFTPKFASERKKIYQSFLAPLFVHCFPHSCGWSDSCTSEDFRPFRCLTKCPPLPERDM